MKKVIFFILVLIFSSKSFGDVYNVENQILIEKWNNSKNFRDELIGKAIKSSFQELSLRLLIDNEKWKIRNIESNEIKYLINKVNILEEKKVNSDYEVKFSISFNKEKIREFYTSRNIIFTDFVSQPIMVFPIIKNKNNYYIWDDNFIKNNWNSGSYKNYLTDFFFAEGDLFDRKNFILTNFDINKVNEKTILKKYDVNNSLIIFLDMDSKINNLNYKLNLSNTYYLKGFSKEFNFSDTKTVISLIDQIKSSVESIWKNKNVLLSTSGQSIIFRYKVKNLKNLNLLKNLIKKNTYISKLEDVEISSNYYSGKIYFSGNLNDLSKTLADKQIMLKENLNSWIITYNE